MFDPIKLNWLSRKLLLSFDELTPQNSLSLSLWNNSILDLMQRCYFICFFLFYWFMFNRFCGKFKHIKNSHFIY